MKLSSSSVGGADDPNRTRAGPARLWVGVSRSIPYMLHGRFERTFGSGGCLYPGQSGDGNPAAYAGDHSAPLKAACDFGHADPADAHHLRKKLLRQQKPIPDEPLHSQKPFAVRDSTLWTAPHETVWWT
jgi:hypothetical protein